MEVPLFSYIGMALLKTQKKFSKDITMGSGLKK